MRCEGNPARIFLETDMKDYHILCADGAEQLEALMKKTAMSERVFVFAIHGQHTGPEGYGRILPRLESQGYPDETIAPNGFTCVRPPYLDRWEGVPYADMHAALYEACKSVPLF
jgi:hypothetical protein